MKCLARNKQLLYYALLTGESVQRDADGYVTGERPPTYSEPEAVYMNLSAARGQAELDQFGAATDYTHTLVTCDMDCPIDENSILWVGRTPQNDTPHNFVVVRVARSLNSITYAIREVKVSKAQ